jgi:hypothetical protein
MSDRTTARRIELILAGTDQASGVFSKAANNVKAALDKMQAQHGPFQPIEAEIRKRMEGRLKGMIEGHAREQLEERAHQRTLAAIAAEGGRSGPLRGDQIDPAGRLARAQQLRAERAEMMRREIGGTAYRDYYGNGFDLEAAGRRSSGTRRGGGGGGGGEGEEEEGGLKGFLKGAHHEIGRGSTLGLLSHLVHGGAIAVLGSTIEHATEKLKEFVETMHEGGRSASELTHKFLEGLPIVGDWAKAGANLRQALDGIFFPEREEAAKRKEEGQDNRDTRVKMQEARDAKRNALIAANRSAAIEAQDALNVAGKRGIDRTYAENQNTYDAKLRQIEEDAGKIGGLNTDQQDEARRQLDVRRRAAQAEFDDKRKEADEQENRELEHSAEEHTQRMKAIEGESHTDRLQLEGRFLTAKLDQIVREAEKEIAEADQRRKDEQRGRDPSDYRYIQAQKRFEEDKAAAEKKASDKTTATNQQDQREQQDAERDHQQKVQDVRVAAATKRIRSVGADAEADKIDLAQRHKDEVEAINKRYDEELRTHKERAGDIERQRKEDLGAEGDRFGADVFAFNKQRGRQFAAQDVHAGGEAALLTGYRNPGFVQSQKDKATEAMEAVAKQSGNLAGYMKGILDWITQHPLGAS